jgi:glycine cleavage system H lipoate-binding protein
MESFRYVDIFATKGIEYIIVMAFLAAFIYFSRYLSHRAHVPAGRPRTFVDYFRVPDGYFFHQGHTWFKKDGREVVTIGIDDFAQRFLGRIDEVTLPHMGAKLRQGDKSWNLISESRIIPMLSPVDGEVIAVNTAALRAPEIINEDPYEKGWLLKVKATKIAANTRNLLAGNVARTWTMESLNGIRMQNGESLGLVYQDGGAPVSGMAKALYGDEWDEEVRKLFLTHGE